MTSLLLPLLLIGCGNQEPQQRAPEQPLPEARTTELPSLQEQLDAKRDAFLARAPAEVVAVVDSGVAQVAASGVLESALREGDTAPDFHLPTANHDTVSLSGLVEGGPVVIAWYRGGW